MLSNMLGETYTAYMLQVYGFLNALQIFVFAHNICQNWN